MMCRIHSLAPDTVFNGNTIQTQQRVVVTDHWSGHIVLAGVKSRVPPNLGGLFREPPDLCLAIIRGVVTEVRVFPVLFFDVNAPVVRHDGISLSALVPLRICSKTVLVYDHDAVFKPGHVGNAMLAT